MVGIDEAGYGPNLGPFVMTSVACRVPEELVDADLWRILRAAVRRHRHVDDGRLLVDDSKLVYSSAHGLLNLERNVLGSLCPWPGGHPVGLTDYLDWACPLSRPELAAECWFAGDALLPVLAAPEDYTAVAERFARTCGKHGIAWGLVRSIVVCSGSFNALLDRFGSKGAVLTASLTQLVRCNHDHAEDDEAMCFHVDKHGGRNNYAVQLQDAVPEGMVLVQQESRQRSLYNVVGLRRPMRLTFQPRADAGHFCVALASMFSKYLRELLMLEFNRFWLNHLPDLEPTAGYPGDSGRFYSIIRPIADRLGIPEAALWRRK
jgi:ribonuclease HII